MHTITATLVLDDTADPPRAAVTVQLDGELAATREEIPPADCIATLNALSQGDTALRDQLLAPVQEAVNRLQQAVDREQAAQAARQAALAEWQQVLADTANGQTT